MQTYSLKISNFFKIYERNKTNKQKNTWVPFGSRLRRGGEGRRGILTEGGEGRYFN